MLRFVAQASCLCHRRQAGSLSYAGQSLSGWLSGQRDRHWHGRCRRFPVALLTVGSLSVKAVPLPTVLSTRIRP